MSNSNARILVVDDNPATRYSTSRILRGAGWSVIEAETGEEAISKAIQGVDLVILDVNLPDMDGFAVCRHLRQYESTSKVPILHLSASFTTSDHKVTGLESGADGYLIHPVEPPVLVATINAFLRTRQAEIELRTSQARFRSIFENALMGVALFQNDFVFIEANPKMCELLGLDRHELTGHRFSELVPAVNLQKIHELLKTRRGWHDILPYHLPDESICSLEWHISVHTDPASYLAIVTDVSERLRYERDRETLLQSERAARSDAERANRLKDEFLATLSHELRTPLNAIVGWSQLLRTGKLTPAEFNQGIEAIERNAKAQSEMISDLLDVSRITSGKLRLDLQSIDPVAVIEAAVTAILPTAEAKSIEIHKSLDATVGLIAADAARLQQVIWNLVNNAVKFTPKRGQVQVLLQRIGAQIEIRISDSGQGISTELLPMIFERFRQGDSSSTREHSGLGLGLAIARQLTELHGGTITADSPGLGLGATFIVSLPLPSSERTPNAAVDTRAVSPSQIDLSHVKVLLVEDDPDSRNVLLRIISGTGAEVQPAASVTEALEVLESFRPHVLISDLGMPVRDGFDLIREVRNRGDSLQSLPAVALTAFARTEDRRRAVLAGFQVHLAKPVDPFELTAVIASLVGRSS